MNNAYNFEYNKRQCKNVISRSVGKAENDCLIKGNREWGQGSRVLFT